MRVFGPSSKLFVLLSAVFCLGLSLPAAAQAGGDTTDIEGLLDTAVVSAPSKMAETVSVAPATSIVISGDDLRRYGIHSLDEAINFLAFGMVTEKSFQTAAVGARGVLLTSDFGSHVLLLIDGNVVNEQWGATAYFDRGTAFPFELIDHIEIVLGPGSVLYGSNAMLGIVNIVTKRAKDFEGGHLILESELLTSLRVGAGVGQSFRIFDAPGELVFEIEDYEQKGPVFNLGPQDIGPDGVTGVARDFDVDPKDRKYPPGVWGGRGDDAYYAHVPSAYLRARLGAVEIGARAALYDRTDPTDSGNFDDPNSHEVDRWLHVDVKHTIWASAAVQVSTRLYGDHYDYKQNWTSNGAEDCLGGQDNGCLWTLYGKAQWVGLEPQVTIDWAEDGRVTTLIGVDGRLKRVASSVNYFDNVTGISPGAIGDYDHTEKALAAYLQQTFWPTSFLAINAGARVDVDDRFGSHGSPRAAVALLPWDGGTFKAIYAEAFRAPTAFDIYYYDPTTQLPGGDLNPETVRSIEGTFEQRFGAQTLHVGVFHSWWDDLLLAQDLSDDQVAAAVASGELEPNTEYAYQVQNVSSIRSYGFDAAYEGSLVSGRLRYGASFTEAIARQEDPGAEPRPLAVAPQVFGNARVSYDLAHGLPTLGVVGRFVTERPLADTPDSEIADPAVEIRGTISGPTPLRGLSYRLSLNWISAKYGADSIGPGTLSNGKSEFVPNDQLRAAVGLQYDFPL